MAAAGIALLSLAGPAAAAPQGTSTTAAACPYEDFCIYSQPNYTGQQYNLRDCHDYPVGFSGIGSWRNNQTSGTQAVFSNSDGSKYITNPAPASSPSYNWTPVLDIKPC
ncbi:peptidase inhibitor family I36 protein [Amycolatopsis sp. NBC_00345]|uniref:peptidase inhibitor family I36 protein n=1 Tax=Amycolatopsis sp. NBC_00345 TaxID=2975955 RepID=UPI002E26993C